MGYSHRALVALCVAFLFIIPTSVVGWSGDDGIGPSVPENVGGPVPSAPVLTQGLALELDRPMVISGLGLGGALAIRSGGLSLLNLPGLPRVPVTTRTIELPAGADVLEVKVSHGTPRTVYLNGDVEIAPPVFAIGPEGSLGPVPLGEVYDGERFPADWYAYDLGRGLDHKGVPTIFVTVFVYPVNVKGGGEEDLEISYITDLDIEVEYAYEEEDGPSSRDDRSDDEYDLLLIGPTGFKDDLQDLADHKDATGMSSKVVTLTEIYSGDYFTIQGRDHPEIIKYFIKDAHEEWGISYVLLGGDVDQVPTRHTEIYDGFDDDGSMYIDGKWVATDIYFGDIYDGSNQFSTWDESGNDVFGQWQGGQSGWAVDDPDFYLDIYVGRLPASNSVELGIMVNKVISYENNTDWSWFFNAGLAGVDTWVDDGSGVPESEYGLDIIGGILQPAGFSLQKYYETKGTLSPTAVNNAINNGLGIMTFSGHGSYTAWGSETGLYYSTSYISSLNNGVKLPVGSQAACETGGFDNEDSAHYPAWNNVDSLAEEFILKSDGGFIADMGSTRVAYGATGTWWPEYNAGYLNKKFYTALVDGQGTPGKMLDKARNDYLNEHGTSWVGDYKHMNEFLLFGDPSVALGGIGIVVETDEQTAHVDPGEEVDLNFTVRNVGSWDLTAALEVRTEGGAWTTQLSTDSIALAKDAKANVTLTVKANNNALANAKGTFTLTARSSINDRAASAVADAVVNQIFGLELDVDPASRSADPGQDVEFNITALNKGNGADGADLSYSDMPSGWGAYLPVSHVDLVAFGSSRTGLTVSLPDTVEAGSYWFNVTAELDGASITRKRTLRVDVLAIHDIGIICEECSMNLDPGQTVDLSVNLSNLGNVIEDITIEVLVPEDWSAEVDHSSYILDPYSTMDVGFKVTAEKKALADIYTITVKASIQEESEKVDLELTVNRIRGLVLKVATTTRTVDGGSDAIFAADVENTGNGPEEVLVSCIEVPEGWLAQGDPQGFTVAAYSIYRLDLVVSTLDSLAGSYDVKMRTESKADKKVADEETLTVTIAERIDGRAHLRSEVDKAYPGHSVTNTVMFENRGNVKEKVTLASVPGDHDLSVTFLDKEITVDPGTSGEIAFTVQVPDSALAGPHDYNVLVERDKGGTINLTGTVDVEQVYGFDLVVDETGLLVEPGERLTKRVVVTNKGNGEDTFSLGLEGDTSTWTTTDTNEVTLGPGMSKTVFVHIDPPSNAAPEYHQVMVTVTSECGASRDGIVDFRVEDTDGTSTSGSSVESALPLILALLIVSFIVARTVLATRKERPIKVREYRDSYEDEH